MKKILSKIIAGTAFVAIVPFSCMAVWTDPEIRAKYIEATGDEKYTDTRAGLIALIFALTGRDPRTLGLKSEKESCQEYLQNYYGILKEHLPNIDKEFLEKKYNIYDAGRNHNQKKVKERLNGFGTEEQGDTLEKIKKELGVEKIKKPQLLAIADILQKQSGAKLDRQAKRTVSVLLKWFDENWQKIAPYMNSQKIKDSLNQQKLTATGIDQNAVHESDRTDEKSTSFFDFNFNKNGNSSDYFDDDFWSYDFSLS